jgi:hypothetical protein
MFNSICYWRFLRIDATLTRANTSDIQTVLEQEGVF